MRIRVLYLGCFLLLSIAIASETDPRPNSSEKLKHWRRVTLTEYDPPAMATPQSQATPLGNGHEHEHAGGKADPTKIEQGQSEVAVPTHLAPIDSDAKTDKQHGLDHPAG
jgi:hypothetical protein